MIDIIKCLSILIGELSIVGAIGVGLAILLSSKGGIKIWMKIN